MHLCPHCKIKEYETRLSLGNHARSCDANPNKIVFTRKNGAIKAKERGEIWEVKQTTRLKISQNNGMHSYSHTEEFKQSQRQRAIDRGLGGVRPSRWIKYKGKTLGSSYELTVVQSLDANGIKWDTCPKFKYIDPMGKCRSYTPDIYLIDYGIYLDPKNDYLINNVNPRLGFSDLEKIKRVMDQNSIRIIVLNSLQLDWSEIHKLL